MSICLSASQQPQVLSSLETQDQNYLPLSSFLVFVQNSQQILYHGYSKPKPSEEPKAQSEEVKPKKKFVFKMGKDKQAKPNAQLTEKLHSYQINSNSWIQLQSKGKIPQPRENQQILMLSPNLLLMYGGKNLQNEKLLNDLHTLNLQTLQWKKLFSIECPPPTDNNIVIKLTQSKIALVNFKQVWTFESKQVKWELNTNELPGGVWENLNIKFDGLIQNEKQVLLGGACISCDLASIKLLVFTCDKGKGSLCSYLLDLSDKEVTKIKMNDQIWIGVQNLRHDFACFQIGLDSVSEDFNQALFAIRTKHKIMLYLTEYDETSHSLKIISKSETQTGQQQGIFKAMGKCFDTENSFYLISSDSREPKKKQLTKIPITIKQNVSEVVSQVQKKLLNQQIGYMNNMKSSQIQSIPEESNESSVVGMRSYPNQRQEQFQEIDNDNFRYQMRRNDKNKMLGSGPSSEVNRSPSALSDEIQSDIEVTERNNESLVKRNDQQIEDRSSFYNDSNVYVSSRKSPGQHDISNNNSSFPQEQHLQRTLQKILVHEHIKRQKLEEKSRFLQKAIQNSEPLAKLLTKYASTSQKSRHIENVKACKQELQTVWNKEVFYRRQMTQHFLSSESEMLSRGQIPQSGKSRSRELVSGKIDMRKLMRKHLAIEEE